MLSLQVQSSRVDFINIEIIDVVAGAIDLVVVVVANAVAVVGDVVNAADCIAVPLSLSSSLLSMLFFYCRHKFNRWDSNNLRVKRAENFLSTPRFVQLLLEPFRGGQSRPLQTSSSGEVVLIQWGG